MGFETLGSFKREIIIDPSEVLLEDCEISIRALQSLQSLQSLDGFKIEKLKDLCKFTEEELLAKSNRLSKKTVQEAREILAEHGLKFKDLE